jgi:hypothetical protein
MVVTGLNCRLRHQYVPNGAYLRRIAIDPGGSDATDRLLSNCLAGIRDCSRRLPDPSPARRRSRYELRRKQISEQVGEAVRYPV